MQLQVGTAPVHIDVEDRTRVLIQNLGPGLVEFSTNGTFSYGTGIRMVVGAVYEFPTPSANDDIWLVASVSSDTRIVQVG